MVDFKPNRKYAAGVGAIDYANDAAVFMRWVEKQRSFYGNKVLDKIYKDALANRRRVYPDGTVVRTARGAIDNIRVNVPAKKVEEEKPTTPLAPSNLYLALSVHEDVGGSPFQGCLVVPISDLSTAPYFATGDTWSQTQYFKDWYTGTLYQEEYTEETSDMGPYGYGRERFTKYLYSESGYTSDATVSSESESITPYTSYDVYRTWKTQLSVGATLVEEKVYTQDIDFTMGTAYDWTGGDGFTSEWAATTTVYIRDHGHVTKVYNSLATPPDDWLVFQTQDLDGTEIYTGDWPNEYSWAGYKSVGDCAYTTKSGLITQSMDLDWSSATQNTSWFYRDSSDYYRLKETKSAIEYFNDQDSVWTYLWYTGTVMGNPGYPETTYPRIPRVQSPNASVTFQLHVDGTTYDILTYEGWHEHVWTNFVTRYDLEDGVLVLASFWKMQRYPYDWNTGKLYLVALKITDAGSVMQQLQLQTNDAGSKVLWGGQWWKTYGMYRLMVVGV